MDTKQHWTLEKIFQGGSLSSGFEEFLKALFEDFGNFKKHRTLKEKILIFQNLTDRLDQAISFVRCMTAQDVSDQYAQLLQSNLEEGRTQLSDISNSIDHALSSLSEVDFKQLLQDPNFSHLSFSLEERRLWEQQKLDLKTESLINALSIDGYHSWGHFYSTFIGQEEISVEIQGKKMNLSWGQAYARLSSPDRAMRKMVFDQANEVWKKHQNFYGKILNHIAGFRLNVYAQRGWDVLKEPLHINRMTKATLDAMWKTVEANKGVFVDYLQCKASLLGLDQLSWYDQEAPLEVNGKDISISYENAARLIIEQFERISPKMSIYAQKAFSLGWIEAEDRAGKAPGGFCTGFPLSRESRIFMTYSGTQECLITLAHELGHAFHGEVMFTLPALNRQYPMNLAETASTFAEMVMNEALLKQEKCVEKRLALLNAKIQRSIVFLFNIHARFLFEIRFYEERQKGVLAAERLCTLMEEAQREAYGGALKEYHPFFWASKMHFNLTDVPFYNFPYTFGYLFSTALYHRISSEEAYIALLHDTGCMTAEALAKKHLKVDISTRAFWQETIDSLKVDVQHFLKLAQPKEKIL